MGVSTSASELCQKCRVHRAPLSPGGWCPTCGFNPEHEAKIAELEKDRERLDWLETALGLHTGVDFLYVVDGYTVAHTDRDGTVELSFGEGPTLRQAIDAARDRDGEG